MIFQCNRPQCACLRHSIPGKDFTLYSVLTKRAGGSGEFKKILKKNRIKMKLANCYFLVYSLSVSHFSIKVCPIENNTNLNSIVWLIKSSKIDLIFLPAFYLIIWLMTSPNNFEKLAILKIWKLFSFWGIKTHFGEKKA